MSLKRICNVQEEMNADFHTGHTVLYVALNPTIYQKALVAPYQAIWLCRTSIDRQLPFELRALESALAAAVRTLEIEAMFLEKQTLPALTRLMQQVSRKELNTIRHSKTSVTKLLGRVTSIKKVT